MGRLQHDYFSHLQLRSYLTATIILTLAMLVTSNGTAATTPSLITTIATDDRTTGEGKAVITAGNLATVTVASAVTVQKTTTTTKTASLTPTPKPIGSPSNVISGAAVAGITIGVIFGVLALVMLPSCVTHFAFKRVDRMIRNEELVRV